MEALPPCRYGAGCYRKNPDHLSKFSHPATPKAEASGKTAAGFEPEVEVDSTVEHCASAGSNLVVVILVGVPGSGKSSFCQAVQENASQTWTRICQDVVANGKRGTKAQCIKEATSALKLSSSVFIDRTNVSKEQRREFVEFGKKSSVEAHAVVLNLPVGTCITRAINRTSHEGGLEGKKVAPIIQKMAQTIELPTLEEGYSRITICRSDADVQNAVSTYRNLGASSKLEPGLFDNNPKASTKGSLQEFFKPTQKQRNQDGQMQGPGANRSSSSSAPKQQTAGSGPKQHLTEKTSGLEPKDGGGWMPDVSEDRWKTLAFPSISTADFRFDHEKAAQIIVETASDFLRRDETAGLRLAMVDIEQDSDMLLRVRKKVESAGLDPRRFLVISGDITKLKSMGGPSCSVIANAANWRLKGGGGGVNMAIYKAAGPGFEEATKQVAKTLDPGKTVAVPLPSSSPLRTREGVTHIIHVLGPNMNPQRPNCIAGNYSEGCRLLRAAYSELFSTFASLAKGEAINTANTAAVSESPSTINREDASRDAFSVLMQSSKRRNGNDDAGTSLKRGRGGTSVDAVGNVTETRSEESVLQEKSVGSSRKKVNWPAWAQALHNTAFHPEQHQNVVLEVTDEAVVIPDLYGKAKKHLLVLSRVHGLDTIADVRKEHLPLLQKMHEIGERWARKLMVEDPSLAFRLGYHWVPSMRQLHLHVISQDFDSPCLKNKKHWNSFTTSFFRDSKDVISELETTGSLRQCSEEMEKELLDSELRCHRCRCVQPTIPRLKSHLRSCNKPLPFSHLS